MATNTSSLQKILL